MKKRGRKRTGLNMPKHITDPNKLPDRVWFNKSGAGKWMLDYWDLELGKWRSKRICGPQASLTEIWLAYSSQQDTNITTFETLSLDYQNSLAFRDLSPLTQKDYIGCHKQIVNTKIKAGKFGELAAIKWSIGVIRKYRDHRAEESRSRANKELSYIKRVFSWAYEYEKVNTNPAKGIAKLKIKARQHYASDKDYNFLHEVAKESNYWYMPHIMEIAYLCRMRLSEVIDITDADELDERLFIRRRKGSKNNIVEWTERLKNVFDTAKLKRNQILQNKNQPSPIKSERRYLFISERTGDKLQVSSIKTAKNRIDKKAKEKAETLGIEYNHFWFHDLKRKGVSDTKGNKQEASGHRSANMLNIYDVKPIIVKPAGE